MIDLGKELFIKTGLIMKATRENMFDRNANDVQEV